MTFSAEPRPYTTREVNGQHVPVSGPVPFGWDRTDEELAALAVSSAQQDIAMCRRMGIEPTPALVARAAGDPERVAAFVAHHSLNQANIDAA